MRSWVENHDNPDAIHNWFDPHNQEHLEAYSYLMKTGVWPEGFINQDIIFLTNWQVCIAHKLAEAWLEYKGITID